VRAGFHYHRATVGAGDSFPAASGARLDWDAVPREVRRAVEDELPAGVTLAESQPGGFSPGAAARLRLGDGSRVFVKAVGPSPNPDAPDVHRREAHVASRLPHSVPAPRLLFTVEAAGWVALAFEDVEGHHPVLPWREDELRLVLSALTELAATLTPSPVELPALADDEFTGFRELVAVRAAGEPLPPIDPWVERNLSALAAQEAAWPRAARGTTLVHTDIRADNVLIRYGRVYVIDWPHAALGPRWADLVFMLPSISMQGGPEPWHLFDAHPLSEAADRDAVATLLCGLTGFFLCEARKPPPPGLPTLRPFQEGQGAAALRWLRRLSASPSR
jgi:aminoglycoside phosphotransferase (APT) family kinase protein